MNFIFKHIKSVVTTASLLLFFSISSYSQSIWELVSEDNNAKVEYQLTNCDDQPVVLFRIKNYTSSERVINLNIDVLQDDNTEVAGDIEHRIYLNGNEEIINDCSGGLIASESYFVLPKEYTGYNVNVEVQ
jgi:hypothetical protein